MRAPGLSLLIAVTCIATAAPAQERRYVPERRAILVQDVDFYGSDLQSIFDTTREACETACLGDTACRAFTFNTRASSCFLKSDVSRQDPYQGAISGSVQEARAGAIALAATRAAELDFLKSADFDAALTQARGLAAEHVTGSSTLEALLEAAAAARRTGDTRGAARLTGAAINLTDGADLWSDYADLLLLVAPQDDNEKRSFAENGAAASINAYLRSDSKAARAICVPE